jgi:phosphoribosylcarboxyaminoimidazole (NCAIR) mutase
VNVPVISCPPWNDYAELAMNLNSSVIMPSGTPNLTVVRPDNAAQAALRALNLPRLRERLSQGHPSHQSQAAGGRCELQSAL